MSNKINHKLIGVHRTCRFTCSKSVSLWLFDSSAALPHWKGAPHAHPAGEKGLTTAEYTPSTNGISEVQAILDKFCYRFFLPVAFLLYIRSYINSMIARADGLAWITAIPRMNHYKAVHIFGTSGRGFKVAPRPQEAQARERQTWKMMMMMMIMIPELSVGLQRMTSVNQML